MFLLYNNMQLYLLFYFIILFLWHFILSSDEMGVFDKFSTVSRKLQKMSQSFQTYFLFLSFINPHSTSFTQTFSLASSLVLKDQNNHHEDEQATAPAGRSDFLLLHRVSAW